MEEEKEQLFDEIQILINLLSEDYAIKRYVNVMHLQNFFNFITIRYIDREYCIWKNNELLFTLSNINEIKEKIMNVL